MSDSSNACVLGIDVGGTKTAAGIVLFPEGRVVSRRVMPTRPERAGDEVLRDVLGLARELLDEAESSGNAVAGIGVGIAELVDPLGNVTSAHTIAWQGVPVRECFSRIAPASVESDVRAAALAEALFGAGRPFRLFIYITVGTGISHSLVMDGLPFAGARGNALIFASGRYTTICTECGAVLTPVLEAFASGPALVERFNRHCPGRARTGADVLVAAEVGEPEAVEVVQTAGEALGVRVGALINELDPEAIVVGGGLGLAGGLYWDSFVASTRGHIWAENSRDTPILPAALGNDAGLIGAAAGLWRKLNLERGTLR